MLLNFTIKNWSSFRNSTTLSMIATRERQHGVRITKLKKYQIKILPVAAIFGGNASGKTNLFTALNFAKTLIVGGVDTDQRIPVEPFLLDSRAMDDVSDFKFELLIDNLIYKYSFSVNRKFVSEEKLAVMNSSSEKVLFERKNGKVNLHKSPLKSKYLKFLINGLWDNQLLLTNAVSHKSIYKQYKEFKAVYNWFKKTLVLVAPDSRFANSEQFIDEESLLYGKMNDILQHLDTGIIRLGSKEIPYEDLALPEQVKSDIEKELKENQSLRLIAEPNCARYVISRRHDRIVAKKLISYHRTQDDTEVAFEIYHESHGSQRVIELLPAFLDLSATQQLIANSAKVYVIDELDRCLHSNLTKTLIETYLNNCDADSRTQLLFTSHDNSLIDQGLFRRDEIWFAQMDASGASSLYSLGEFKDIRYDKEIRKNYLQGRFGGTPEIQPAEIAYDFSSKTDDP